MLKVKQRETSLEKYKVKKNKVKFAWSNFQ